MSLTIWIYKGNLADQEITGKRIYKKPKERKNWLLNVDENG